MHSACPPRRSVHWVNATCICVLSAICFHGNASHVFQSIIGRSNASAIPLALRHIRQPRFIPRFIPRSFAMQRLKRSAYRMRRLHRKLEREEQELQLTEEWQNAVKLEEIVIPEEFNKTPAMKLWYLARCDAHGHFIASAVDLSDPSLQMAHNPWNGSMYSPWKRLLRRIKIASQLAPLIFPSLVQLVWDTAGPRILLQFAAEIAFGLCKSSRWSSSILLTIIVPAWGTWSQGQLVDAVQKSLYSQDVARDTIIRYTVISLIASNITPVANALLWVRSSDDRASLTGHIGHVTLTCAKKRWELSLSK